MEMAPLAGNDEGPYRAAARASFLRTASPPAPPIASSARCGPPRRDRAGPARAVRLVRLIQSWRPSLPAGSGRADGAEAVRLVRAELANTSTSMPSLTASASSVGQRRGRSIPESHPPGLGWAASIPGQGWRPTHSYASDGGNGSRARQISSLQLVSGPRRAGRFGRNPSLPETPSAPE
jgi:hypothetical protein